MWALNINLIDSLGEKNSDGQTDSFHFMHFVPRLHNNKAIFLTKRKINMIT
jgi:hypothetical protein